jgi:hypothetical protein
MYASATKMHKARLLETVSESDTKQDILAQRQLYVCMYVCGRGQYMLAGYT